MKSAMIAPPHIVGASTFAGECSAANTDEHRTELSENVCLWFREGERWKEKEKERKKLAALAPIAKPLAGKKLCKRTLKLVRRAAEQKCLKRGVKEVVKSIRRGHKGLCVIAGNISPIDVITHVPILCEENDISYIYVPSKEDLANAGATKRPTCCVLVLTKPTKGELGPEEQEKLKADYDQVVTEVSELTSTLF